MDPSYQAGQSSNPIRKPDLKKKLVVVGDGAGLTQLQLVQSFTYPRNSRRMRENMSPHRVRKKSIS
jgi:hypothetical protein